jgi:hypothetical protein
VNARFAGVAPREARARRPLGVPPRSGSQLAAIAALALVSAAGGPPRAVADPGRARPTQEYPMHAGVSPASAPLGQRLTYRGWVAVERFTAVGWTAPDSGGSFTWGALHGGRAPLAVRRAGGPWPAESVWVEAPLQVFATGPVVVPGLAFTLDRREGVSYQGRLPTVRIGIESQIAATDTTAELRPPRGPLAAPWWERVPWTLLAAGAVVLGATLLVLRRRRRRPAPAAAKTVARRRDPAAEALGDLAALRRMMLLEAGRFDEHALRLSRILRRYLEATLGALRPGDSTPELLQRLQAGLLGSDDVERLRKLLRRWDAIKFARFPSDLEEGRRCEEAVRELVLRRSRGAGAEGA